MPTNTMYYNAWIPAAVGLNVVHKRVQVVTKQYKGAGNNVFRRTRGYKLCFVNTLRTIVRNVFTRHATSLHFVLSPVVLIASGVYAKLEPYIGLKHLKS